MTEMTPTPITDFTKTCGVCGKITKNQGGMNLHMKRHNRVPVVTNATIANETEVIVKTQSRPSAIKAEIVTFLSPRAHGMTLIVTPDYWTTIDTPGGQKQTMIKGKTVEFENGIYRTTDPEIIEYLEQVYADKADPRYPVISTRLIAAARG